MPKKIKIDMKANPVDTEYFIEKSADSAFTTPITVLGWAKGFDPFALASDVGFFYRAKARNRKGTETAWSSIFEVKQEMIQAVASTIDSGLLNGSDKYYSHDGVYVCWAEIDPVDSLVYIHRGNLVDGSVYRLQTPDSTIGDLFMSGSGGLLFYSKYNVDTPTLHKIVAGVDTTYPSTVYVGYPQFTPAGDKYRFYPKINYDASTMLIEWDYYDSTKADQWRAYDMRGTDEVNTFTGNFPDSSTDFDFFVSPVQAGEMFTYTRVLGQNIHTLRRYYGTTYETWGTFNAVPELSFVEISNDRNQFLFESTDTNGMKYHLYDKAKNTLSVFLQADATYEYHGIYVSQDMNIVITRRVVTATGAGSEYIIQDRAKGITRILDLSSMGLTNPNIQHLSRDGKYAVVRFKETATGAYVYKRIAIGVYLNSAIGVTIQNLKATNITASSVTLSWDAVTMVSGLTYELYRGSTLIYNGPTNGYTDNTVLPGKSYDYTVKAKDADGQTSPPSSINVAIDANLFTLTVSNIATTSADLSWTSLSGATYELKINGSVVYTGTNPSYSATGLPASDTQVAQLTATLGTDTIIRENVFSTSLALPTAEYDPVAYSAVNDGYLYDFTDDGNLFLYEDYADYKYKIFNISTKTSTPVPTALGGDSIRLSGNGRYLFYVVGQDTVRRYDRKTAADILIYKATAPYQVSYLLAVDSKGDRVSFAVRYHSSSQDIDQLWHVYVPTLTSFKVQEFNSATTPSFLSFDDAQFHGPDQRYMVFLSSHGRYDTRTRLNVYDTKDNSVFVINSNEDDLITEIHYAIDNSGGQFFYVCQGTSAGTIEEKQLKRGTINLDTGIVSGIEIVIDKYNPMYSIGNQGFEYVSVTGDASYVTGDFDYATNGPRDQFMLNRENGLYPDTRGVNGGPLRFSRFNRMFVYREIDGASGDPNPIYYGRMV